MGTHLGTPVRLDRELVNRGLAPSRTAAAALVAAGAVTVDGVVARRAAQPVGDGMALAVAGALHDGLASRAALKLRGALKALAGAGWDLPRPGARCLDVGASTGGFTDVLLAAGAAHVVALDVGHGQLVARLRDDPRTTVLEGFNARDLVVADLPWRPELVVADVSFISLTLLVGPVAAVLAPGGRALLMVKPQFEVGRERLGADGVVRSATLRAEAVLAVVRAAAGSGLVPEAVVPSPLPGPHGNREVFVLLAAPPAAGRVDAAALAGRLDAAAARAAQRAAAWTGPDGGGEVPPVAAVGPTRSDGQDGGDDD